MSVPSGEPQQIGAKPGWYRDPASGLMRWWDGSAWTERFAPTTGTPTAVTPSAPRTNHILHLLLTVFTAGIWAPIWLGVAIYNTMRDPARRTSTNASQRYTVIVLGVVAAVLVLLFVISLIQRAFS